LKEKAKKRKRDPNKFAIYVDREGGQQGGKVGEKVKHRPRGISFFRLESSVIGVGGEDRGDRKRKGTPLFFPIPPSARIVERKEERVKEGETGKRGKGEEIVRRLTIFFRLEERRGNRTRKEREKEEGEVQANHQARLISFILLDIEGKRRNI